MRLAQCCACGILLGVGVGCRVSSQRGVAGRGVRARGRHACSNRRTTCPAPSARSRRPTGSLTHHPLADSRRVRPPSPADVRSVELFRTAPVWHFSFMKLTEEKLEPSNIMKILKLSSLPMEVFDRPLGPAPRPLTAHLPLSPACVCLRLGRGPCHPPHVINRVAFIKSLPRDAAISFVSSELVLRSGPSISAPVV